jgi:hypothetical protein
MLCGWRCRVESRDRRATRRRSLPLHVGCLLVLPERYEFRMAKVIFRGPLHKLKLPHQHRLQPQCRMPDYAVCILGTRFWMLSALNSASLAVLLIGIVRRLEVTQKRQQIVVWLESPDGGIHRRRFLERIFLERKVRVKVDLRSLDRLVSQP